MARLRPLLRITSPLASQQVVGQFAKCLRESSSPVEGLTTSERLELHLPSERVHLWSPQLIVQFIDRDDGCELNGRFGPHPNVWTIFVAAYAACAFLGLLSLSFAYAQWAMTETPSALAGLPLALGISAVLHLLAFWGQDRGRSQMTELEAFVRLKLSEIEEATPHQLPRSQQSSTRSPKLN